MSNNPHPLLVNLNPQQAEAVAHHGSPLLIIAGAGSGKTRVITHRIAYLAHAIGIPLWQILAVTFTNKAAREMRERVCRLMGVPDDPRLSIGTFHSRCATILRREADAAGLSPNFAILDDKDQTAAIKKAMAALDISEKRVRPAQALHFVNTAKMKMLTPKDVAEEFADDEIPYDQIYAAYEEILQKNNSLDFEDLIFRSVQLFTDKPDVKQKYHEKYRYILVDEFQDTNVSQFELIKLLVGEGKNICVVGDEDQSIYSWRGADVRNLLQFREAFPDTKLVRLEQNYRSVGNVLKAAGAVIEHNTMRIGKTLWTEQHDGELIRGLVGADDQEEGELVAQRIAHLVVAEGISAAEVAVFYRSHYIARPIEDAFRKFRLPYRIVGGIRFYDRAEIKDILSFMRLASNPNNDLAFERVVNVPTRGMGPKACGDLYSKAAFTGVSYYQAAKQLLDEGQFKGKARTGMTEFIEAIGNWHNSTASKPVSEILDMVLRDTRYEAEGIGDPSSIDGAARLENIEEFKAVVAGFEEDRRSRGEGSDLNAFLEGMALDAQANDDDGKPRISLMTVHNAKGLEFDHVFVVGMDNGVFPNSRTFDKPEDFEEERRLFYVAITRARQTVTLCRAGRRRRNGLYEGTTPSVFLNELPEALIEERHRTSLGVGMPPAPSGFGGASYAARTYGSQFAPGGIRRPGAPASSGAGSRGAGGAKTFTVGDRVNHAIMGEGSIVEMGGRPGNQRVMVEFDDGRSQEFVVRFAPLTKV